MNTLFKLSLGFILFFFLVFQPMRANLLSSVAVHNVLSLSDQTILFNRASLLDPCNGAILNALGDAYIAVKNPTMATITYGDGVKCSPANALMRYKYGYAMILSGFDGMFSVKEAIKLEPHNPYYLDLVKKLQPQSP